MFRPRTVGTPRPRRHLLLILLLILLAIFLLYAGVLGLLALKQESLLFYPVKLPADFVFNKPDVIERHIEVPGAELSALHFRQANARGLIFFLHGNAGNLDLWLPDTALYRKAGFDVFMIDYRGFGKSTGHIQNEAQLHADVLAAWNSVAGEYAGRPVVLYGRSLGSGLAARLATEVRADQLILVSPYASFLRLGHDHFPWAPSFVTRYTIRTDQWLPKVRMPILMIEGGLDKLVAPDHAIFLQTLRPDAELVMIDAAGHNDIHTFPAYTQTMLEKLAQLAEAPAALH